MPKLVSKQPAALTIAGSDSCSGAGLQTDLRTFASLGLHGTCAVTCITAQNPMGVFGVQPCKPAMVQAQIQAVFDAMPPAAAKTGMLFSPAIIEVVAEWFKLPKRPPLVVDPVMVATSGARLLKPAALSVIRKKLLPAAALITPNLPEAELLLGRTLAAVEDLRDAARELHERHGCAALVKGGHLPKTSQAIDIFFDGRDELLLEAPFIQNVGTHGTGCTYSAAIAGCLALGLALPQAVINSKQYITQAIAQSRQVGRFSVLNNFWTP